MGHIVSWNEQNNGSRDSISGGSHCVIKLNQCDNINRFPIQINSNGIYRNEIEIKKRGKKKKKKILLGHKNVQTTAQCNDRSRQKPKMGNSRSYGHLAVNFFVILCLDDDDDGFGVFRKLDQCTAFFLYFSSIQSVLFVIKIDGIFFS